MNDCHDHRKRKLECRLVPCLAYRNRRRGPGYDLYRDRSLEENGWTAAPAALKWFLSCCCRIYVKSDITQVTHGMQGQ
jgi:hypothetical protein